MQATDQSIPAQAIKLFTDDRAAIPLTDRSRPVTESSPTQPSMSRAKIEGKRLFLNNQEIPLRGLTTKASLNPGESEELLFPATKSVLLGKKGPKGGVIEAVVLDSDTVRVIRKPGTPLNNNGVENFTYLWEKITIYEKTSSEKVQRRPVPIEEALRPPWFSPRYSNWYVGSDIYEPFFGTGSIVDQAAFEFQQSKDVVASGTSNQDRQDIMAKIKGTGGDKAKIAAILEAADPGQLADVPDVESAADILAYVYGLVTQNGNDVHKFIKDYTDRPIATMEDMFGSWDLEYDIDETDKLALFAGTPGFHSRAILPYDNLIGLLDDPDTGLVRLNTKGKGKKEPISRALDPRLGRRRPVEKYIQELTGDGSLAIGLKG